VVLPDSDNVARYCKPSSLDPETRKPNTTAFEFRTLKEGQWEKFLSVDWLEYLHPQPAKCIDQVATLRAVLKQGIGVKVMEMRPAGVIAVVPVSAIHQAALQLMPTVLTCRHEPRIGAVRDPHSGVHPDPGVEQWPQKGSDSAHLAIQQYLFMAMAHWEPVGEKIP